MAAPEVEYEQVPIVIPVPVVVPAAVPVVVPAAIPVAVPAPVEEDDEDEESLTEESDQSYEDEPEVAEGEPPVVPVAIPDRREPRERRQPRHLADYHLDQVSWPELSYTPARCPKYRMPRIQRLNPVLAGESVVKLLV
jgi:hypothetical protein